MYVVATAGHVDHGKSTLVRALTGMEPDRWAEERRRGLTIDLGFAWSALPSGRQVAFVDVPGHERFLGNMVAGLGPVEVVCFVVAADEGWAAQSSDHRDVIRALGISHGLLVLTRCDRATRPPAQVLAEARAQLADTGLHDAPAVCVSALHGTGLDELRTTLDALLAGLPHPDPQARLRLWIDRSFSIDGAGTVVTGTLGAGHLAVGDQLELVGRAAVRPVAVRGLHSLNQSLQHVVPASRVAVNLRPGVAASTVHRGDVLVTPQAWDLVDTVDVRRTMGGDLLRAPAGVRVHLGTIALGGRLRPLDEHHARISLERALPLQVGDRLVLRGPDARSVLAGVQVLDIDPPSLARRGDARRRAADLAGMDPRGDAVLEVSRRGAVSLRRLERMGIAGLDTVPGQVLALGDWWVHRTHFERWQQQLRAAVDQHLAADPLSAGLPRGAAARLLGPDGGGLLDHVLGAAGLETRDGLVTRPGRRQDLGEAEDGIRRIERMLCGHPFDAPQAAELAQWGLGARQLAAAERRGRLLRLGQDIVVLPDAPARAMRILVTLPQPFTTSQARRALDTTRRVAIPLLEYLDSRGFTRRVSPTERTAG